MSEFKPRPLRWIAKTFIKFIIGGLKAWAESERASVGTDTVWDWLTDQVFVVQRRYAFSVGCIAFSPDKGRLRLLMVERPFEGFGDDKVLLWPGGRVKGADKDFESEVRRIVKDETGCNVTLLAVSQRSFAVFSEDVDTYNPRTEQNDIPNSLLHPPIMVMQQNRLQSHDVPGHIDLLYLGYAEPHQKTMGRGKWVGLDALDDYPDRNLWPDQAVHQTRSRGV